MITWFDIFHVKEKPFGLFTSIPKPYLCNTCYCRHHARLHDKKVQHVIRQEF
ncbi:hypothetical protein Hanom_Chr11g01026061 [Helianthus anomalus]